MEKEERGISNSKPGGETELLLQWGSRKRLRCVRVRVSNPGIRSGLPQKEAYFHQPTSRKSEVRSESRKSSSEKEEIYYTTRGSVEEEEENAKIKVGGDEENLVYHVHNSSSSSSCGKKTVWPKLCIALSSKEKEEDFMAMKGSKLPQRPKKRAKLIQKTLLLVSPGAWLSDMSFERYEVREKKKKKSCNKKARGLKAMGGCIQTDSE